MTNGFPKIVEALFAVNNGHIEIHGNSLEDPGVIKRVSD